MSLPYRDFFYPLNVFMHILTHEEGGVDYLHYALFESGTERIGAAQERSTELLLSRLPPPPPPRLRRRGDHAGREADRHGAGALRRRAARDLRGVRGAGGRHGVRPA